MSAVLLTVFINQAAVIRELADRRPLILEISKALELVLQRDLQKAREPQQEEQ